MEERKLDTFEKLGVAKRIVSLLDEAVESGNAYDAVDILEISAKLALPHCHVRLVFERF